MTFTPILVKHCGFTPMDVIVATTTYRAMACFMEDNIGTIEPGKSAVIIIVNGNHLADITILQNVGKIKMVILAGKIDID